jgi:hypothetical protein
MNWLEEIKEFDSYLEYKRFINFLSARLNENEIEEIEPKEFYLGTSPYKLNRDRWFKDCSTEDLWRLVPPDYPFKGFFKKVIYPLDGYKGK